MAGFARRSGNSARSRHAQLHGPHDADAHPEIAGKAFASSEFLAQSD